MIIVADSSVLIGLSSIGQLDDGEAEAIALARERNANVVLLDERDARETAKRLGLRVLGTVGLLIWGRREGMVQSLKSTLTDLQDEGNFRPSRSLFEFALRQVGEME